MYICVYYIHTYIRTYIRTYMHAGKHIQVQYIRTYAYHKMQLPILHMYVIVPVWHNLYV